MMHYPRMILGATSTGLGVFFKDPKNSLLVESSSMIGADFAACFYPGEVKRYEEFAHPLLSEAVQRGILHKQGLHLPGFQALLFDKLKAYSKNCLFLTEFVKVQRKESVFHVTLFNKNGFCEYSCDELIDTTVLKVSNQKNTEVLKSSIGAVFIALQEGALLPQSPFGMVIQGGFDNEFYFHLPLEHAESAFGRELLIQKIREHKEVFEGWGLAATATDLCYKVSREYEGYAKVIDPNDYSGCIEAFYFAFQLTNVLELVNHD